MALNDTVETQVRASLLHSKPHTTTSCAWPLCRHPYHHVSTGYHHTALLTFCASFASALEAANPQDNKQLTRTHKERTTRPDGSRHERHWQWKVKSLAQVWGYLGHCRSTSGYSYSTSSRHLSIQFKVIKDQPDSPDSRLTLGGSEGLGLPEGVVKLLRKQLLTCHVISL